MDEKTIQVINEVAERFRQAVIEAFRPVIEHVSEVLGEIAKIAQDVINAINQRQKERSKWRIEKIQATKTLFLDKRSKVHRCRNAI